VVATLVMPKQRKPMDAMLQRAGVAPARTEVALGAPGLAELTGARQPSGVPVPRAVAADGRDRRPHVTGTRSDRSPRGESRPDRVGRPKYGRRPHVPRRGFES
jgi:hypothetical protein